MGDGRAVGVLEGSILGRVALSIPGPDPSIGEPQLKHGRDIVENTGRCELRRLPTSIESVSMQPRQKGLHANDVLFIQTGGTIDKEYPKTVGGYNFEIGEEPAVTRILTKIRPSVGFDYTTTTVCRKDSQEITQLEM